MSAQLLLYRFGAEARYEGQLVGALERIESRERLRVLDVLFVQRDADSGELAAVTARGRDFGELVAALLDFRLDADARQRATARALGGKLGDAASGLGSQLTVGEAFAVVLIDDARASALGEAVARNGGTMISSEAVEATRLADLGAALFM